jgi:hypothetical protein
MLKFLFAIIANFLMMGQYPKMEVVPWYAFIKYLWTFSYKESGLRFSPFPWL